MECIPAPWLSGYWLALAMRKHCRTEEEGRRGALGTLFLYFPCCGIAVVCPLVKVTAPLMTAFSPLLSPSAFSEPCPPRLQNWGSHGPWSLALGFCSIPGDFFTLLTPS